MFNLIRDPKEKMDMDIAEGWMRGPIRKMILEFQESLKVHPPIPPGAPDDHVPRR